MYRRNDEEQGSPTCFSSDVLEAASLKVEQVELYVAVDNPRGWKFYRKFGF